MRNNQIYHRLIIVKSIETVRRRYVYTSIHHKIRFEVEKEKIQTMIGITKNKILSIENLKVQIYVHKEKEMLTTWKYMFI